MLLGSPNSHAGDISAPSIKVAPPLSVAKAQTSPVAPAGKTLTALLVIRTGAYIGV